jgi:hypothetical protein
MIDETRKILMAIAFAALLAGCDKAAETPPEVRHDIAVAQTQSETDVAMAKAEGDYRVAIERCDALTGAERQACVDQAVQVLNAAKDATQGLTSPPQSQ